MDIPLTTSGPRRELDLSMPQVPRRETRLTHLAQQRLLDMLAPSAVLIDRNWRVLYICGDVDCYLKYKSGVPTDNLLEIVRRGLRTKLRGAVHTALTEDRTVSVHARVQTASGYAPTDITVQVVKDREQNDDLALVVFEDADTSRPREQADRPAERNPKRQRGTEKAGTATTTPAGDTSLTRRVTMETDIDDDAVVRQLEEELSETKDELQASIEQLEASNEEFKASNEEVMSINEELQSTNEELETSKEELQSLNEELSTVNNQLANKVDELETKHADLENLVAVTDMPVICLDTDLTVRWFTPAAQHVIRLKPADRGRPLEDFAHDFNDGDLVKIAKRALKKLTPVEDEVTCRDHRTFIRRVTPYRTDDHHISGVVITFVDITRRIQTEHRLLDANESLEQQVTQRTAMLKLLQGVTRVANEARSVDEAMRAAMERISQFNGWQVGHVWRRADDNREQMVSSGLWYVSDKASRAIGDLEEFQRLCAEIRFSPGEVVVGAVAQSGQPIWIDDIVKATEWRRGDTKELGLHAMIAFPVTVNSDVVGVLEFFSDHPAKRDKRFMEVMPDIGIQLGHVIERKRLERGVADAAESEQRRIGSDIHDGVGQELTGLRYLAQTHAEALAKQSSEEAAVAERMVKGLEAVQQQLRSIIRDLVPVDVDQQGLVIALRSLVERTEEAHAIACVLECEKPLVVADHLLATHIYRIVQEAVTNAARHAEPRHITVRLTEVDNDLQLEIINDGKAFDPQSLVKSGFGIRSMRFRAELIEASLDIVSPQEGGTVVVCKVPISKTRPQGTSS